MVGLLVFGFTSLLWGAIGVVMTVLPQIWSNFIYRAVEDDWKRFWLTQIMILVGLVLTIGTAQFQGTLVWSNKFCIQAAEGVELEYGCKLPVGVLFLKGPCGGSDFGRGVCKIKEDRAVFLFPEFLHSFPRTAE